MGGGSHSTLIMFSSPSVIKGKHADDLIPQRSLFRKVELNAEVGKFSFMTHARKEKASSSLGSQCTAPEEGVRFLDELALLWELGLMQPESVLGPADSGPPETMVSGDQEAEETPAFLCMPDSDRHHFPS